MQQPNDAFISRENIWAYRELDCCQPNEFGCEYTFKVGAVDSFDREEDNKCEKDQVAVASCFNWGTPDEPDIKCMYSAPSHTYKNDQGMTSQYQCVSAADYSKTLCSGTRPVCKQFWRR
jgi:hypothetical protein